MGILEQRAPDKSLSFRKRASKVLSLFPSDKKGDNDHAKDMSLGISQPMDNSRQFASSNYNDYRAPLSPSSPQRTRNSTSQTYPKSILKRSSYVPAATEPAIPVRDSRHTLATLKPLPPTRYQQKSQKFEPPVQNSVEYLHTPSESPVTTRFPSEKLIVETNERAASPPADKVSTNPPHSVEDDDTEGENDSTKAQKSISEESIDVSGVALEGEADVDLANDTKKNAEINFPTEFSPSEPTSPLEIAKNPVDHQKIIDEEARASNSDSNHAVLPSEADKNIELLKAWENNSDCETFLFCCIGPEQRGNSADVPPSRARANRQSSIIGDDLISLRSAFEDKSKPPNFSRKQSLPDISTSKNSLISAAQSNDVHSKSQYPKYATAITTPERGNVLSAKPAEDSPAVSCPLRENNSAWYVRQKFTTTKAKITGRSCVSAYYANA